MKSILLISICLLLSLTAFAGEKKPGGVTGTVLDNKKQQPVDLVDVMLYTSKDSVFVKHTMSNEDGVFSFDGLTPGNYFIKAKLLGYREAKTESFEIRDVAVEVPVKMEADEAVLSEVVVTGKKQFVEQHADKMVINPEATISTASDNILDVLGKSPGIVVDKDGNISLKGKSGITILIDDKPTYMSGDQLAAMLKNLQASTVERIEIMENPPAKYDAEGSTGVINIRTKRGTVRGFNGSLSANTQAGKYWRGHTGLDLNYRNEKWNIYGGLWGGFFNGWDDVDLTRKFPEGDGSTFKEYAYGTGHSDYSGLKLGVDYYLTKDQVIGFMGLGSRWKGSWDNNTQTDIYDWSGNKTSHENTMKNQDNSGNDWTANLNYRWTVDTLGRSLSADLDYAHYTFSSGSDMKTTYIPEKLPQLINNYQDSYTNIYSFKVDYTHPFSKAIQLDAGLKTSLVDIDSDLDYKQKDNETGNWADPTKMSNRFKYSENINALYTSFKYKWNDSWDMQLGLRGEQTRSEGNNVTIDSINNQNYFNLFPTAFLQKTFSEKHQVNLSYAYRIGRPDYWLLNPFIWMLNPYTYNQGNPNLQPQFTHSMKLAYTLNQKYILSLGYAYTQDQYTQVFEQNDETKVTVITWRNLTNVNNADATLTIPVQVKKWLQINANLTGFYIEYKLPDEKGEILNRHKVTFRGNLISTFSLPKDWSVELSGWYVSKTIYGVMDMWPEGSMDAGIQKRLFDSKLSVKLGVTDVFNTLKGNYGSTYQNMDIRGIQHFDSRRLQLNLTWRFGQDNIKPARERKTGLEEESGRAGK